MTAGARAMTDGRGVASAATSLATCPRPEKRRYATMAQAGSAAARVRTRSKEPWRTWLVGPYLCPCEGYHIGKRASRGRRIKDIVYRARVGLVLTQDELDLVGGEALLREQMRLAEVCRWCGRKRCGC